MLIIYNYFLYAKLGIVLYWEKDVIRLNTNFPLRKLTIIRAKYFYLKLKIHWLLIACLKGSEHLGEKKCIFHVGF